MGKKNPKKWERNAPKHTPIVLRQWVQGRTKVDLTNHEHLNLHNSKSNWMSLRKEQRQNAQWQQGQVLA